MLNMLNNDDIWKIIENFLLRDNKKELIKHQIESYDVFLEKYIKDIIMEQNPYIVDRKINDKEFIKYTIIFENISYGTPIFHDKNNKINILYPKHARERNLTYALPLCVNFNVKAEHIKDGKVIEMKNQINKNEIIGNIPLMIGSKYCLTTQKKYRKNINECSFDNGGYFIVSGSEKVVISQERMSDNSIFIFKMKDKKYSHIVEVRANTDMTKMANVFKIKFLSKDGIRGARTLKTSFNNLKDDIPLLVLFKYFGAETDEEVIHYILGSNDSDYEEYLEILKPSIIECNKVLQDIEPSLYIKKYLNNKSISLDYLMDNKVLSHIKSNKLKLFYLGHITKKLLNVLFDREPVTDRDNFINKRVETPGILMAQLFRKTFRNSLKALKMSILKETSKTLEISINKFIKKSIIENGLKFSLSTGNWNAKVGVDNKKIGVAQMLSRLTFTSTLSHLRRLNAPVSKTGKLLAPRKLHNSQYGVICPAESPEGHSVGLVKNLSLSTNVTTYSDPIIVKSIIEDFGIKKLDNISPRDILKTDTRIFINGSFFGVTNDPINLVNKLRLNRRKGRIPFTVSISFKTNINEIIILTDEGRLTRPLFIVKDNDLNISKNILQKIKSGKITWQTLLSKQVIEYLDINEMETSMLALNQDALNNKNITFTHCEIHPSLMFGICASLIPFPEHNQAPRNVYQCAQGKQAIGINSTTVLNRFDTISHVLHYPQKPIVYTKSSDLLGMNKMPAGDNLIIAIATHTGYNMEDSVIINRGAIERGMFHSTSYRTYKTEEKKDMSALAEEKFCIPDKDKCIGIRQGSYHNLDSNGLIKPETIVKGGDIIIGKMTPDIKKSYSSKKNLKYKDTSIQLRHNEAGIVDKVLMTNNAEGYRLAKVRIRKVRRPIIADKVCSRHGQKGTIGIILDEEDMPFSEEGMVPDIIINPHCIPSRMTIAQLLECILGKTGAIKGKYFDGTPFQKIKSNELGKLLEDLEFNGSGRETLMNGETGQKINTQIFIGPTYYQRLKHMVEDKMHARATGPTNALTRGPTEGRSREGGLRMGNMELDCLNAHGVAYYLQDKFVNCCDKYTTYICDSCGLIANVNTEKNISECKQCHNKSNFSHISLPYASKLLFYEIGSMGITSRFRTK